MECRERTSGEQREHLAAINRIVARWQSGEYTLAEKRELIARENAFFHGQTRRGRTGKLITADTAEHQRLPSHADEDRDHIRDGELPWWQDA
jgi:hypothetical protein